MKLYHATYASKLDSIRENGLRAGSYWSDSQELADYYAETIAEEGDDPVVLVVDLADLDVQFLAPDDPSIAEPITMVIGKSEDEVIEAWDEANGTWEESLEIVGSVKYRSEIPMSKLEMDPNWNAAPSTPRG